MLVVLDGSRLQGLDVDVGKKGVHRLKQVRQACGVVFFVLTYKGGQVRNLLLFFWLSFNDFTFVNRINRLDEAFIAVLDVFG